MRTAAARRRRRQKLQQPAVGPGQRLLSGGLWLVYGAVTLAWLPLLAVIFLLTAPFDRGRYTVGRWFRRAAVVEVALNPLWRFRVSGVRIRDPRRPYIGVSNHESFADIYLISHLPWEMKWLSKESIFAIPVVGWMMRMAGDIEVRRSDTRSRIEALGLIRDRLKRRVSVMVMPEGTRSTTGEVLPFKDGAFRVAIETGTPILPMAVAGTSNAMRKGSLLFNRARAEVRVLDPIETTGLTLADVATLREQVRSLIITTRAQLLHELRGETGSANG